MSEKKTEISKRLREFKSYLKQKINSETSTSISEKIQKIKSYASNIGSLLNEDLKDVPDANIITNKKSKQYRSYFATYFVKGEPEVLASILSYGRLSEKVHSFITSKATPKTLVDGNIWLNNLENDSQETNIKITLNDLKTIYEKTVRRFGDVFSTNDETSISKLNSTQLLSYIIFGENDAREYFEDKLYIIHYYSRNEKNKSIKTLWASALKQIIHNKKNKSKQEREREKQQRILDKKLEIERIKWEKQAARERKKRLLLIQREHKRAEKATQKISSYKAKAEKLQSRLPSAKLADSQEKTNIYRNATRVRNTGLSTLIAAHLNSGHGLKESIKKSTSLKMRASVIGLRDTFDPLNIIGALTFRSPIMVALAAKMFGRSGTDASYFSNKNRKDLTPYNIGHLNTLRMFMKKDNDILSEQPNTREQKIQNQIKEIQSLILNQQSVLKQWYDREKSKTEESEYENNRNIKDHLKKNKNLNQQPQKEDSEKQNNGLTSILSIVGIFGSLLASAIAAIKTSIKATIGSIFGIIKKLAIGLSKPLLTIGKLVTGAKGMTGMVGLAVGSFMSNMNMTNQGYGDAVYDIAGDGFGSSINEDVQSGKYGDKIQREIKGVGDLQKDDKFENLGEGIKNFFDSLLSDIDQESGSLSAGLDAPTNKENTTPQQVEQKTMGSIESPKNTPQPVENKQNEITTQAKPTLLENEKSENISKQPKSSKFSSSASQIQSKNPELKNNTKPITSKLQSAIEESKKAISEKITELSKDNVVVKTVSNIINNTKNLAQLDDAEIRDSELQKIFKQNYNRCFS